MPEGFSDIEEKKNNNNTWITRTEALADDLSRHLSDYYDRHVLQPVNKFEVKYLSILDHKSIGGEGKKKKKFSHLSLAISFFFLTSTAQSSMHGEYLCLSANTQQDFTQNWGVCCVEYSGTTIDLGGVEREQKTRSTNMTYCVLSNVCTSVSTALLHFLW